MRGHLPQEKTSRQSQKQKAFGMENNAQEIATFQSVLDSKCVCVHACTHPRVSVRRGRAGDERMTAGETTGVFLHVMSTCPKFCHSPWFLILVTSFISCNIL